MTKCDARLARLTREAKTWADDEGKLDTYADGGYPLFYVAGDDCEVICPKCANDHETDLAGQIHSCAVNWEDPDLYCDACGERIPSAYAEPEEAPAPAPSDARDARECSVCRRVHGPEIVHSCD